MKNIMVLFNPMTLVMMLFLVYGIVNLRRKRRLSATVSLVLFGCLAFNTVLLFIRAGQSQAFHQQTEMSETERHKPSNQAAQATAPKVAEPGR